MLIAAKNRSDIDKLKGLLSSAFKMKDLGTAWKILGMKIKRDLKNVKLWLTQTKYANKVLARFNMEDCKPISTPLAPHFKLSSTFCPSDAIGKGLMSKIPYGKVVGSLMYLMTCTRLDIALSMGKVSKYMLNLGKIH